MYVDATWLLDWLIFWLINRLINSEGLKTEPEEHVYLDLKAGITIPPGIYRYIFK